MTGTLRLLRLSPSALERYRACPKRFWFQDIKRIRVDEARSPVLAQANALHHALERFYGLPPDYRSGEALRQALRAVWSQHRAGAFSSPEEEVRYGEEALQMLDSFAEQFDLLAQPLAREHRVHIKLRNETRVTGKIDRVDPASTDTPDGDDGIDVIDYKTGRRIIDRDDLRHESATQLYVVAAEHLFKQPVRKVRWIYLRSATEVTWHPEREDVDALRDRLVRTCGEVATANVFPAVPAAHCDWCPYQLSCEERQQVVLRDLVVPEGFPF